VKKLFLWGNLPYAANETDLQNFFCRERRDGGFGHRDGATVSRSKARGFGFVEIKRRRGRGKGSGSCAMEKIF